jgi:hypothetical protein
MNTSCTRGKQPLRSPAGFEQLRWNSPTIGREVRTLRVVILECEAASFTTVGQSALRGLDLLLDDACTVRPRAEVYGREGGDTLFCVALAVALIRSLGRGSSHKKDNLDRRPECLKLIRDPGKAL